MPQSQQQWLGSKIITQQPTIPVCQPADQPNYLAWRTKSARQPARFLSARQNPPTPPSPSRFLNERPSHTRACVLCLPLHPPLQCPIQPNPHIGCDYASNSLHKHDRHFQQWRAKHRRHCGPVDRQARKQALQRLVQVEQQHTQAREIREQKVPEVYQFVFSLSHPDPTFTCCFLFLFSFLWR